MNQNQYQSVDDAQAQATLQEAAAKCTVVLDVHGTGRQVRLDCPFSCPGDHAGKRELSVDTGNPQKVFACHAYLRLVSSCIGRVHAYAPPEVDELLPKYGKRSLVTRQQKFLHRLRLHDSDPYVRRMINLFDKHRRGLEQELLLKFATA